MFNRAIRNALAVILATASVIAGVVMVNNEGDVPWKEIPATQQIRYNVAPATWENWGPGRSLEGVLVETRQRLERHQGEGFRIKERGTESWSFRRNLRDTMIVLNSKLQGPVEVIWLVNAELDDFRLKLRGHDYNPAVYFPHPDATQPVGIIIGTLMKLYPDVKAQGVYVCRPIDGSLTPSQHSYGNAVDVFGTWKAMDTAAYGMYDLALAGYVPASQILWNHRNLFTGHYVSNHTTHIHFSGDPLMSGPCRRP